MWTYDILNIMIIILFFVLYIFGIVQCRKHSFKAGFYFFLILLIMQISNFIFPPFLGRYIDSMAAGNTAPPMGWTIGEWVLWLNLIPRVIEVIAFSILVIGLYQMWKSKRTT